MVFDIEKYLPYLDHYDWSREEKIEMLSMLWRMMETQADKAFCLSAMQLSDAQNENKPSQNQENHLDSKNAFTQSACQDAPLNHQPLNTGGQDAAQ